MVVYRGEPLALRIAIANRGSESRELLVPDSPTKGEVGTHSRFERQPSATSRALALLTSGAMFYTRGASATEIRDAVGALTDAAT